MQNLKRKYDDILNDSNDSDLIVLEDDDNNDDDKKPECKYGSKCYRKNKDHLNEFKHTSKAEAQSQSHIIPELELSSDKIFLSKIHSVPNQNKINSNYSLSLNEILSIDKHEFVESAQFNYMHDLDWLMGEYPKENRYKPLTIIHGNSRKTELDELAEVYTHVKLIKAKLESAYGTHHSKMMFLLYKTGLRIVIHTANLIEMDWMQKTQGIWISDKFPLITDSKLSSENKYDSKTKFKMYLLTYLENYKEEKLNHWINLIKYHDMSKANVFLIASVPGRFPSSKKIFGHVRLRKLLSDNLKLVDDSHQNDNYICQFSSIGSLGPSEDKWLCKEFLISLSSSNQPSQASKISKPILIYPSVEDVAKSYEGFLAGASLPYSKVVASKQSYLNNFFFRWKSNKCERTRASPHIKTFARYSGDYSKLYWFLLTSANLSKAAWGSFEKNETQYHILSYEIGVLFLPCFLDENKNYFELKSNQFLVPYDLPPIKYDTDKDKPWVIEY